MWRRNGKSSLFIDEIPCDVIEKSAFRSWQAGSLTSGQPKVLDFLLKYQEADQKTIAAYCEIEQATVGSILLRMEKAGLVLRRNREGNRRSLYVSLTDKGQKAAEKMMDVFRREEEKAVSGLSTEEVDTLKNILLKLCGSIEQSSKEKRTEL